MECLTLGSLFDGIGGWQLAAIHFGVTPVWSSEIDSFPASVTAYHFPKTAQLGDITKVDGAKITPVDIICAGSPCQNLSQAGNRKGLNGENSSLFLDATRIFHEMRNATNGKYPRFFVWENVTGAFSSNHGNDFRTVLEKIGQTEVPVPKSGRWGGSGVARVPQCDIAWRTLDAQYWGVPQRRRRIFLVADFATTERRAAEILFVEKSLRGDSTESSGKEQSSPNGIRTSSQRTGNVNTYSVQAIGHIIENDKASALKARDYKGTANFVGYERD